jgi:hypothetical protein
MLLPCDFQLLHARLLCVMKPGRQREDTQRRTASGSSPVSVQRKVLVASAALPHRRHLELTSTMTSVLSSCDARGRLLIERGRNRYGGRGWTVCRKAETGGGEGVGQMEGSLTHMGFTPDLKEQEKVAKSDVVTLDHSGDEKRFVMPILAMDRLSLQSKTQRLSF